MKRKPRKRSSLRVTVRPRRAAVRAMKSSDSSSQSAQSKDGG